MGLQDVLRRDSYIDHYGPLNADYTNRLGFYRVYMGTYSHFLESLRASHPDPLYRPLCGDTPPGADV